MRQLTTICLIILLSLSLKASEDDRKTIISSASMIWDMVNNIGKDKINSLLIVPVGGDPHIYEPTPSDAREVEQADLVFINGLTFEGWINELIENSGTKAATITLTEGVEPISSTEYENSYDPHAWMDVRKGRQYIENIKNALIELDPNNATYYKTNFDTYDKELQDLDIYIEKRIEEIPKDNRILITSHDAFRYYGKRYGIQVEGVMGISTESEAQTSDMVRISSLIKNSNVPAVFIETTINPKLLKQIAADNNVSIGGALYADSIGEEGSGADYYIGMMKKNTDLIVDALKGSQIDESDIIPTADNGSKLWTYLILGVAMILSLLLLIVKMNKS